MKTLAIFSMTVLFALAVVQGQAQTQVSKKEAKKEVRTEKKSERKTLRALKGSVVSDLTKRQFYADFGNLPNVTWKRLSNLDEATFVKRGHETKAYYDYDGKLVGTTKEVTFDDLPDRGQKLISTKYQDYSVGRVIFYNPNETNESDMMLYGVQFESDHSYFVELTKGGENIVLRVDPAGFIYFFKQL